MRNEFVKRNDYHCKMHLTQSRLGNSDKSMHRYVVLDVETTGLSPLNGDRVIEIGAVAIESKCIVEEFSSLVNIGKTIPLKVQQIHGITNEMLAGKPKPEEVMPFFHKFIRNSSLIAHNARFDINFLRYEFARFGLNLPNRYFCTLEQSRKRYPRLPNHRLETVFRHLFGEPAEAIQRHRALGDARMTAMVWLEMRR